MQGRGDGSRHGDCLNAGGEIEKEISPLNGPGPILNQSQLRGKLSNNVINSNSGSSRESKSFEQKNQDINPINGSDIRASPMGRGKMGG